MILQDYFGNAQEYVYAIQYKEFEREEHRSVLMKFIAFIRIAMRFVHFGIQSIGA